MKPSILIADDDNDLLDYFVEIGHNSGFRVLAATCGQEAVDICRAEHTDIVLLDFGMPDISGIDAMAEIKEIRPSVPVFIMSGGGDIHIAVTAIKRGACDFIVKPMDFVKLLSTLKKELPAPPTVPEGPEGHDKNMPGRLTGRQREILALTSAGHSSTAIGDLLNISYRTVETHREKAMRKLNLRNRSEVISFAINNDILRKTK